MKQIYLYPGKLAAANEPTQITTILGSCVAVALFDPTTKIGGLNHYLLPEVTSGEPNLPRYGSCAIPELVDQMVKLGAAKNRLKAKVFGGASVLNDVSIGEGIGKKNIDAAFRYLEQLNIPVMEKNVGGLKGRRIVLTTDTFEVEHRLHASTEEEQAQGAEDVDISGFQTLRFVKNIKVVIVDDSATVRNLFHKIFTKHGLQVVGMAANAYEAREIIVKTRPDVITLDIEMPKMTGVAFLEKLMAHLPIPVVMVSSLGSQGDAALRALELGAVEFVHKPSQYDPSILSSLAEVLVGKVRAAASVNVLKARQQRPPTPVQTSLAASTLKGRDLKMIVIGGNAGSQQSLDSILTTLSHDTPPVLVTNSTMSGYWEAYKEKMKKKVSVGLSVAKDNDWLKLGQVYFSPPETHMSVVMGSHGPSARLNQGPPVMGQIPSADILFSSAAEALGASVLGVLLSGYGSDGVEGLKKIQSSGGFTIAEHPDTAKFPYAPQKAITIGVADEILPADKINSMIWDIRNRRAA